MIRSFNSLYQIAEEGTTQQLKMPAPSPTLNKGPDFFVHPNSEFTVGDLMKTKGWAAGAGWQTPEAVSRMFGIKSSIEQKPSAK
jgi:hypothetical protein